MQSDRLEQRTPQYLLHEAHVAKHVAPHVQSLSLEQSASFGEQVPPVLLLLLLDVDVQLPDAQTSSHVSAL